jgi:tetratricopeptide (TPR) repeat protein
MDNKGGNKTVNKNKAKPTGGETQNSLTESAKKLVADGKRFFSNRNTTGMTLKEAFEKFSKACNDDPSHANAFYYRGLCYMQQGDFQRALYDFTLAFKIEKDNGQNIVDQANYLNMAGECHWELGQLDEALRHYEMAIRMDKKGDFLYNRALVRSRQEKY